MIQLLDTFDKKLFIALNGLHHPFLDGAMWLISSTSFWIPLYVGLAYLMLNSASAFKPRFKIRAFIIVLLSAGLAILLSDQISSGFCKPFFERLRPSHYSGFSGLIHLIPDEDGNLYKGGMYGFVSSHAANSFAVAWLVGTVLKNRVVWVVMILWATLVSYSRIYLGVHYPGDILCGGLVGVGSGYIAARIFMILHRKWVH